MAGGKVNAQQVIPKTPWEALEQERQFFVENAGRDGKPESLSNADMWFGTESSTFQSLDAFYQKQMLYPKEGDKVINFRSAFFARQAAVAEAMQKILPDSFHVSARTNSRVDSLDPADVMYRGAMTFGALTLLSDHPFDATLVEAEVVKAFQKQGVQFKPGDITICPELDGISYTMTIQPQARVPHNK